MKIRICPICVAVSGTWIALLIARYFGQPVDLALISMLMGGSVVGITYTLEKKLPVGRSAMAWKIVAIVSGMVLVYGFLREMWMLTAIGVVIAAIGGVIFFSHGNTSQVSKTAKELEDKMKQCC